MPARSDRGREEFPSSVELNLKPATARYARRPLPNGRPSNSRAGAGISRAGAGTSAARVARAARATAASNAGAGRPVGIPRDAPYIDLTGDEPDRPAFRHPIRRPRLRIPIRSRVIISAWGRGVTDPGRLVRLRRAPVRSEYIDLTGVDEDENTPASTSTGASTGAPNGRPALIARGGDAGSSAFVPRPSAPHSSAPHSPFPPSSTPPAAAMAEKARSFVDSQPPKETVGFAPSVKCSMCSKVLSEGPKLRSYGAPELYCDPCGESLCEQGAEMLRQVDWERRCPICYESNTNVYLACHNAGNDSPPLIGHSFCRGCALTAGITPVLYGDGGDLTYPFRGYHCPYCRSEVSSVTVREDIIPRQSLRTAGFS